MKRRCHSQEQARQHALSWPDIDWRDLVVQREAKPCNDLRHVGDYHDILAWAKNGFDYRVAFTAGA